MYELPKPTFDDGRPVRRSEYGGNFIDTEGGTLNPREQMAAASAEMHHHLPWEESMLLHAINARDHKMIAEWQRRIAERDAHRAMEQKQTATHIAPSQASAGETPPVDVKKSTQDAQPPIGLNANSSEASSVIQEAPGATPKMSTKKTSQTPSASLTPKKKSSWLKRALVMSGAAAATVVGLAFCGAQNDEQKTSEKQDAPAASDITPATSTVQLPNDGHSRRLYRVTADARIYDAQGQPLENRAVRQESCVIGEVVQNVPESIRRTQHLILAHDGKNGINGYIYGYNLQDAGNATSYGNCKAAFMTMALPVAPPPVVALPPVRYAEVTGSVNLRLSTDQSKNPWGYIESGSCVVLEGQQRDGMARIRAKMENHPERMQSGFWMIESALREFSPADGAQCFAKLGKGAIPAEPSQVPAPPVTQNYPAPAPVPAPASPSTRAFAAYSVVSAIDAEILTGPSFSSGINTRIKAGECVLVKGKDEASGFTEVAVRKSGVMVSGWLGALQYDVNNYCDFTESPAQSGPNMQGNNRGGDRATSTFGRAARSQPERTQPNYADNRSYKTIQPSVFSDQPERGGNAITLPKDTCVKLHDGSHPRRAYITLEQGQTGWVSKHVLRPAPECR